MTTTTHDVKKTKVTHPNVLSSSDSLSSVGWTRQEESLFRTALAMVLVKQRQKQKPRQQNQKKQKTDHIHNESVLHQVFPSIATTSNPCLLPEAHASHMTRLFHVACQLQQQQEQHTQQEAHTCSNWNNGVIQHLLQQLQVWSLEPTSKSNATSTTTTSPALHDIQMWMATTLLSHKQAWKVHQTMIRQVLCHRPDGVSLWECWWHVVATLLLAIYQHGREGLLPYSSNDPLSMISLDDCAVACLRLMHTLTEPATRHPTTTHHHLEIPQAVLDQLSALWTPLTTLSNLDSLYNTSITNTGTGVGTSTTGLDRGAKLLVRLGVTRACWKMGLPSTTTMITRNTAKMPIHHQRLHPKSNTLLLQAAISSSASSASGSLTSSR